jgi:putative hydrolase of the HAD superfamily
MIDGITFDLWQTLIVETPESAKKVRETRVRSLYMMLQGQGYGGTMEDVERAIERVGERLQEIWQRHRDVSAEEQVRIMLDALDHHEVPGDPMTLANLEWAYVSPILQAPPVLNAGAVELLGQLKGRYRLGLICNTGRTPGAMLKIVLQRLRIFEYFDALIFSDVIGVRKPDPQIFHLALEGLGIAPDRAIHVGDDPSTDIAGALDAGMWAVLLGPHRHAFPDHGRVRVIEVLEELPRILEEVAGCG